MEAALRSLGGAAPLARLVEVGCGWDALQRAVRAGEVVRLARGRYALVQSHDAHAVAVQVAGYASHLSAARHWGLALARLPGQPHVTLARTRSRVLAPGAKIHWSDLPDGDAGDHVTNPLRTVLDCARTLPFGEALSVADSALRQGLVQVDALQRAAQAGRGKGAPRARLVARHADWRAANPFESQLRALALDAGLGVVPQLALVGHRFRARADLVDVRRRLVVEADSYEFHGNREAFAVDCRRYDELLLDGWLVLRFAWPQVTFDQTWVREVLGRAATRPQRGPVSSRIMPVQGPAVSPEAWRRLQAARSRRGGGRRQPRGAG